MNIVTLNNGVDMPLLGLGVFQVTDQKICEDSILDALKAGYRMIDTAACYGNEQAVGSAIRKSGIERNKIFISSKAWIQDAGYDKTMISFEKTLKNLQTDYLDLYLIHMPYGDYYGSYRAMEELLKAGKIRAIGVCNFLEDRLVDLIQNSEIVPAVNQMEIHPFCQQRELRRVMKEYHVVPMAWAPFAEGNRDIFQNEVLVNIGQKYGKSAAQVILRWLNQSDIITIPKSVHKERIEQNFNIMDFKLDELDMEQIEKMDEGRSLILNITSLDEVKRLYNIRFQQ